MPYPSQRRVLPFAPIPLAVRQVNLNGSLATARLWVAGDSQLCRLCPDDLCRVSVHDGIEMCLTASSDVPAEDHPGSASR